MYDIAVFTKVSNSHMIQMYIDDKCPLQCPLCTYVTSTPHAQTNSVIVPALAFLELYVRILMTATCVGSVHLDIMGVHSGDMTYRTQISNHRYINCPENKILFPSMYY